MAASGGYAEIVQLLVDNNANVNITAKSGSTALQQAADYSNMDIIEMLKDAGAVED